MKNTDLHEQETLCLAAEDAQVFADLLESSPEPPQDLLAATRRHRDLVECVKDDPSGP